MGVDFKTYKVAKQYHSDSKLMMRVIDLSIRGLQPFIKYKPVANILAALKTNKAILEAHLKTAEKLMKEITVQGDK